MIMMDGRARILWVLLLVLLCWSSNNGSAVDEEEYLKYKDPKQPVGVRVKDLLSRMTLAEKIGQMVQIDRSAATPDVMKDYYIGNLLLSFRQFFLFNLHLSFLFLHFCYIVYMN